jgi:O-acetyl-ADP-ribose deacetylase (regulator of RNase III)
MTAVHAASLDIPAPDGVADAYLARPDDGAALALQFKQAYPGNFRAYETACRRGDMHLGRMFTYETGQLDGPRLVINFPTKGHWRSKSKLSDIEAGLASLRDLILERHIESIAIPPLGCGNGGLDWNDVRPLIVAALGDLPGVRVMVYPPQEAPPAQSMPVRTRRPRMTPGRAALLAMLGRYVRLTQAEEPATAEGASLLEIQKLMYFLQERGQPLQLDYVKGRYGPYAENLNHALEPLEGHYVRGYGDRSDYVLKLNPITLMPGAVDEARDWIEQYPDEGTADRIGTVAELVTGRATPAVRRRSPSRRMHTPRLGRLPRP